MTGDCPFWIGIGFGSGDNHLRLAECQKRRLPASVQGSSLAKQGLASPSKTFLLLHEITITAVTGAPLGDRRCPWTAVQLGRHQLCVKASSAVTQAFVLLPTATYDLHLKITCAVAPPNTVVGRLVFGEKLAELGCFRSAIRVGRLETIGSEDVSPQAVQSESIRSSR